MLRYICSVGLCKCSLNIFCFIGLFKKLHILKYTVRAIDIKNVNWMNAKQHAPHLIHMGIERIEIGNLTIYKSNTMIFALQCNVWLKLNKKMPANSIHSGFGLSLFHFLLFIFFSKKQFSTDKLNKWMNDNNNKCVKSIAWVSFSCLFPSFFKHLL